MSTLTLATKWHYLGIRKAALQALQKMRRSAIEKVTLGRALKISRWLIEGYQELSNINDTKSITEEEAATIGWETTVKLQQIREERLRNRTNTSSFTLTASSPASSNSGTSTPIFDFSLRKGETSSDSGTITPIFDFSLRKEKSIEAIFKDELAKIRSEELQYSTL
jgi:hypothetical protein